MSARARSVIFARRDCTTLLHQSRLAAATSLLPARGWSELTWHGEIWWSLLSSTASGPGHWSVGRCRPNLVAPSRLPSRHLFLPCGRGPQGCLNKVRTDPSTPRAARISLIACSRLRRRAHRPPQSPGSERIPRLDPSPRKDCPSTKRRKERRIQLSTDHPRCSALHGQR